MKKILLISFTIGIVIAQWTISTTQTSCICKNYVNSADCTSQTGCAWNSTSSTCSVSCSSLSSSNCAASQWCYWNTTACNTFNVCSELYGTSADTCSSQQSSCTLSTNSTTANVTCQTATSTTCANQQSTCYQGTDGFCFNSTSGVCGTASSCTVYSETTCPSLACYWNSTNCIAALCSQYQTEASCSFVYTSVSASSIQPCLWNSTACLAASSSSSLTTQKSCLYETMGLYHWSASSDSTGSCVSCFDKLLLSLIVILGALMF